MSSFLKDLPCRNPDNFSRFHAAGAIRQTSIRPTYTAKLDTNCIEIINDPVPMLIHRLSKLPKDESRKRPMPVDESQVPSSSFSTDQAKRSKQSSKQSSTTNDSSINPQQQPQQDTINCDVEFS